MAAVVWIKIQTSTSLIGQVSGGWLAQPGCSGRSNKCRIWPLMSGCLQPGWPVLWRYLIRLTAPIYSCRVYCLHMDDLSVCMVNFTEPAVAWAENKMSSNGSKCVTLGPTQPLYFRRKSGGELQSHALNVAWTLPKCLLGVGQPGPTRVPALSNTRCRSLNAVGAGGWGVGVVGTALLLFFLCARACLYALTLEWSVEIVVDEFITKDMASSTLSPLLSGFIVTNRPHEGWHLSAP